MNDPASTIVVICAILIVLILYLLGMKKKASRLALDLIEIAEEFIVSETGNEKHCYVTERLYPRLLKVIKLLYNKEDIDELVELTIKNSKYYLNETLRH